MTKAEIRAMYEKLQGKTKNPKAQVEKPAEQPVKKAVAKPKAEPKKARRSRKEIAVNKIFKSIRKSAGKDGNKKFEYDFVDGDGYITILDGHRILRTIEKIEERNPMPKDETPFDVAKCWTDVEKCIYRWDAPTAEELKAGIKNAKAEWKTAGNKGKCRVLYCFNKYFVINAQYLLDAVEAVGNSEVYIRYSQDELNFPMRQAIRLASENYRTQALILPINPMGTESENTYKAVED